MVNTECRCPQCGKLLGKVTLVDGTIVILETWCKHCKQLVNVVAKRAQAA